MPKLAVILSIDDPRWTDRLPEARAMATRALDATIAQLKPELAEYSCEVSLTLADDHTIRALNHRWRGKDKATNVLSFETGTGLESFEGAPVALGDIVLAFETIQAEAMRDGKTFAQHAAHLLVHGMAHLLGYDHDTDTKAEAMEMEETKILSSLGIANPYIIGV